VVEQVGHLAPFPVPVAQRPTDLLHQRTGVAELVEGSHDLKAFIVEALQQFELVDPEHRRFRLRVGDTTALMGPGYVLAELLVDGDDAATMSQQSRSDLTDVVVSITPDDDAGLLVGR
jgi:hypothetical protein